MPLLSVVTITYNHAQYIGKCIEGVLMQRVNFPMEFIIAEDCSTDETRSICVKYAKRYPNLIRLIVSDANVGVLANERRAFEAVRGKYVAYCEGDDYWTDPLKLQRQVDFLESHPDYSVCFHRCLHYDVSSRKMKDDLAGELFANGDETAIITLDSFFKQWVTQPLSMVYRQSMFDYKVAEKYVYYRDMHQIYHLLKNGSGCLMSFIGGIRTIHEGGMVSKSSNKERCKIGVNISKELYTNNHDKFTKEYYADTLQWNIDEHIHVFAYSIRLFLLSGNVKKFVKNCLRNLF